MTDTRQTPGGGKHLSPKRGRRGRAGVYAALAVGLLLLAACLGWLPLPVFAQTQTDILPDTHAQNGTLGDGDAPIAPGNYRVVMDQQPVISGDGKSCTLHFENPSNNQYAAHAALYDAETGTLLGHSKRIDPGKALETLPLEQAAGAGQSVLAVIELFEAQQPVGSLQFQLTLRQDGEGE